MSLHELGRVSARYETLMLECGTIDVQELGVSLQGLGGFVNSLFDFYATGKVKKNPKWYEVRSYTVASKSNAGTLDIVALHDSAPLSEYETFMTDMAPEYIGPMIEAIVQTRLGHGDEAERIADRLIALGHARNAIVAGIPRDKLTNKLWLQNIIDTLSERNIASLQQLVRPVGRSCKRITIGNGRFGQQTVLGEAEAFILAADKPLRIEPETEYTGVLDAIDQKSRSCRFHVLGDVATLSGRITDPLLVGQENVYAVSMRKRKLVKILGKAVTRNGNIEKLFISNIAED